MTPLATLIAAAREARAAHGAHGDARLHGSAEFGELAKADKAALQRFDALAAKFETAEALAALQPALAVRSAADRVALASHRANAPAVRDLLGAMPWPGSFPEALARYGEGSLALEVWDILVSGMAFAAAWPAFLAVAMPVDAIKARTMDEGVPAE